MVELSGKAQERTPYVVVALQECERMNNLTQEIRRSLKEVDLGLKVLWYCVSIVVVVVVFIVCCLLLFFVACKSYVSIS